jgi:DNA polymerase I
MLIFDIETNGFLREATKIHCLVIYDTDTGATSRFSDSHKVGNIEDGLRFLMRAPVIGGHNVLKFDLPVIQKLYPWWSYTGEVRDSLILARLAYPELGAIDDGLIKLCKLPGKYRQAHSLEAWGYRLGVLKSEYDGDPSIADPAERYEKRWATWNQTMEDYCVQDVVANTALFKKLATVAVSEEAVALEQETARIIQRQEAYGFAFDLEGAYTLYAELAKQRLALVEDLKARFGWWLARDGKDLTPKREDKKRGYATGAPLTKLKKIHFNPSSRQHIAKVLRERFGWVPDSYTPTGQPEISEESLKTIKHPEAASLLRFLTIEKRIGQLAEGDHAWIKYSTDGIIHGSVNTLGTVTGRMSHAHPNIAQVPAVRSDFGPECRRLFRARSGRVLVGCDAAALELCVLAHYLARFDGGTYAKAATEGDKSAGTDVHTLNMKALGLTSRDTAKTWFYAFIYGAGDEKLGRIVTGTRTEAKNRRTGKNLRRNFMVNLPAMGKLIDAIKAAATQRKHLVGIDGRKLHVRSAHSAPNTLFQSTGALLMKRAMLILDKELQDAGLRHSGFGGEQFDYEFVANIHDEWQIECRPDVAEQVGRMAARAITQAGVFWKLRCPLSGEFSVGQTWADTH